jgi:hypothetical protein
MGNRTWCVVRTLALAALAAVLAASCPKPIDDELLLVVADEIAPLLTITDPAQGSTYGYTVDVDGTLFDSSQTAGDGQGFVRTLEFSVPTDPMLDRTITFERDGSFSVDPDDSFQYTPVTGEFMFTVNTSTLTGAKWFNFTATDLNANQAEQVITLLPGQGSGPAIEITSVDLVPAGPDIDPDYYSSQVTTSITIQGHVDPEHLEPGSTSYRVQGIQSRPETPFTPDTGGNFQFEFYPQNPPELVGGLTVYIWAKDTQNRLTEKTLLIYDDPSNPSGTFTIASDAAYATSPSTSLTFSITDTPSGMYQMRFNNDGGTWSDWEDYNGAAYTWSLTGTDGTRTVNAQFSDKVMNVRGISDTIVLDTVAPSMTSPFLIDDDATYTTDSSRMIELDFEVDDATSGMYQMRLRNDGASWGGWQAYADANNMDWQLADADGSRTVFAEFTDHAGHVQTASDSIILDRYAPTVSAFVINDGDAWTNSRDVNIDITASDAGSGLDEMRFHNDVIPPLPWSDWEPFADTKEGWQLKNQDSDSYTVRAEIRDKLDHTTTVYDAIGLDRVNPVIATFTINNNDASTSSLVVDLQITASDDRSGMYQMRFSNDGSNWSSWETYATTKSGWTMAAGGSGPRTVHVEVSDQAGNSASSSDSIEYIAP